MLSVSSTTPNAVQPLSRSPSPSPSATHLLPQSHPERPSPIRAPRHSKTATTTASRTSSDSSYDSKRGHYSGLTPSPMDCAPRLSPTDQVAHFNTHRGNIIEYQFPTHASIAGVEYKSIPSGAHAIAQDVIYFLMRFQVATV
ncbi:hypothetical protein BASA83_003236 [Batrachochytrium salamandrivorans]|nr:hypothetical protein BASA83_003236 [Batrachochytrium salamandrivorans]